MPCPVTPSERAARFTVRERRRERRDTILLKTPNQAHVHAGSGYAKGIGPLSGLPGVGVSPKRRILPERAGGGRGPIEAKKSEIDVFL